MAPLAAAWRPTENNATLQLCPVPHNACEVKNIIKHRRAHARTCTVGPMRAKPRRRLITSPCRWRRTSCCATSAGCPPRPGGEGGPGREGGGAHGRGGPDAGSSCDRNCKRRTGSQRMDGGMQGRVGKSGGRGGGGAPEVDRGLMRRAEVIKKQICKRRVI